VDFVHEPLSVFRSFTEFSRINPVVKAPTLVLDDGTVLMDSSLILDYLEALAPADKKLLPQRPTARARDCRYSGSPWPPARKVCRSSTNTTCGRQKQHAPWIERVTGQLLAAYTLLDKHLAPADGEALTQASLTAAVAWSFSQFTVASVVKAAAFPPATPRRAAGAAPGVQALPHRITRPTPNRRPR
jgi:glutathione S-transferase